eukprot:3013105-Rhodomonas_salina.1
MLHLSVAERLLHAQVIPERRQQEQLLLNCSRQLHPVLELRRRAQVQHQEVRLLPGQEVSDLVLELERLCCAERREVLGTAACMNPWPSTMQHPPTSRA